MTSQNENENISENYADLIIGYYGDRNVLNAFPQEMIEIIDATYAIVHVPIKEITERTIQEYGYSAMPNLYGLTSRASLEASGILRTRNVPYFNLRGQGVLLGIVDTGIEYTNSIFKNADNTTRIISIWDQSIATGPSPTLLGYGTEYLRGQINEALQSERPYDLVPSRDTDGHGTMVAGIAGGSENLQSDFSGVAPDAEFVIVKLKQAKQYLKDFFFVQGDAPCYQENDILYAVNYLALTALTLRKPMAILLALGTSQGGHSGRGLLDKYLNTVSVTFGIATVISAGNEGNGRRHYHGIVSSVIGYDVVALYVGENENGFSMELWGRSPNVFSFDLLSPSGEYIPRVAVGMNENLTLSFVFEQTVIYVDYQMVETHTGGQLILFRFEKPAPGIWRFHIYERGGLEPEFNIWLPMGNFISDDVYFIRSNPYTTILGPGNAAVPITVTAYNIQDGSLYLNASRGYTTFNDIKPTLAAPGVNVTGPTLEDGFTDYTGTGIAAAHTAGAAALLLEWGIIKGNLIGMSTVEMKKLMIRGARRDPDLNYPNRDWGYGVLDIYNVFDSLRAGIIVLEE